MKRTAAYARVSSGKDAMLHSLSAQVSYYNQLIQSNPEWLFCGVYADKALTGTKENRAEFQKLLMIQALHVSVIAAVRQVVHMVTYVSSVYAVLSYVST